MINTSLEENLKLTISEFNYFLNKSNVFSKYTKSELHGIFLNYLKKNLKNTNFYDDIIFEKFEINIKNIDLEITNSKTSRLFFTINSNSSLTNKKLKELNEVLKKIDLKDVLYLSLNEVFNDFITKINNY